MSDSKETKLGKGHEKCEWLSEDKSKCEHNKNFLKAITNTNICQSWVELLNKIIVKSKKKKTNI